MIDVVLEIGERPNTCVQRDGEYDRLTVFEFGVRYKPGSRPGTITRSHYYQELVSFTEDGRSLFEGYSFCKLCGTLDYDATRAEKRTCRGCGGDLLAEEKFLSTSEAVEEILSRSFRADLDALRRDYYEAKPEQIILESLATETVSNPPIGRFLRPERYRDAHCKRYRGAVSLAPALDYLPQRPAPRPRIHI